MVTTLHLKQPICSYSVQEQLAVMFLAVVLLWPFDRDWKAVSLFWCYYDLWVGTGITMTCGSALVLLWPVGRHWKAFTVH